MESSCLLRPQEEISQCTERGSQGPLLPFTLLKGLLSPQHLLALLCAGSSGGGR